MITIENLFDLKKNHSIFHLFKKPNKVFDILSLRISNNNRFPKTMFTNTPYYEPSLTVNTSIDIEKIFERQSNNFIDSKNRIIIEFIEIYNEIFLNELQIKLEKLKLDLILTLKNYIQNKQNLYKEIDLMETILHSEVLIVNKINELTSSLDYKRKQWKHFFKKEWKSKGLCLLSTKFNYFGFFEKNSIILLNIRKQMSRWLIQPFIDFNFGVTYNGNNQLAELFGQSKVSYRQSIELRVIPTDPFNILKEKPFLLREIQYEKLKLQRDLRFYNYQYSMLIEADKKLKQNIIKRIFIIKKLFQLNKIDLRTIVEEFNNIFSTIDSIIEEQTNLLKESNEILYKLRVENIEKISLTSLLYDFEYLFQLLKDCL
jgi:hypothetical protein